jgi:cold shock CspA family protein/ribosome-associated translation inhibitor RaiA
MQFHWVEGEVFLEADRDNAEARIRMLADGHTDLIDVRITARPSGHHRHGGQEVRITGEARGKEIVAARTRPDAGLALNEALDVFEQELRQLRDRRGRQGEVRELGAPTTELGVIDEIVRDDDHGFILTSAGERVYFHRHALHGALDFDRLEEGQRVGLNIEGGENGLQATVVRPPPPGTV